MRALFTAFSNFLFAFDGMSVHYKPNDYSDVLADLSNGPEKDYAHFCADMGAAIKTEHERNATIVH